MTIPGHVQATFSLDEAAAYLGCSRWTLRDQVTRGDVPHHRRGRVKGVYFTRANLDDIVAGQARGVRSPLTARPSTTRAAARVTTAIPEEFARLKQAR